MFDSLTQKLSGILHKVFQGTSVTERQVQDVLKEIHIILIESDVSVDVAKSFCKQIEIKATGAEIIKSTNAQQVISKIIYDELVEILGGKNHVPLNTTKKHTNILMLGLQASGKTTTTAKLAKMLKLLEKRILLVSLDTYRPAAQKQLEVLANSIDVDSLEIIESEKPLSIVHRALQINHKYDVTIFDTAGRLHIDSEMINELKLIQSLVQPSESILVLDALTGQDAINIAKHFQDAVEITGSILTRIDSDAKGGAALSVAHVTKKPIKFMGTGEKIDDLEKFDPPRIASRILDMGDVLSLAEKASKIIDKDEAEKTAKKMQQGNFTFIDYVQQVKQLKKMGSLTNLLSMIPGMSSMKDKLQSQGINDKLFDKHISIISSMTKDEKLQPTIINESRKQRISKGAGVSLQDVNTLLLQFQKMKTMMKKMSSISPSELMKNQNLDPSELLNMNFKKDKKTSFMSNLLNSVGKKRK